jgi:benzoyl-CoA reductase/2-hydroxyglutaryl-CoA dehydratase subunit BcrC/BadD/HgdB
MNKLPKNFDGFADPLKEKFLDVKSVKDKGEKVIGYYCSYVPAEIIMAADARPIGLCSMAEGPIPEAEKVLPRNLCPLIKSSYGFAVLDTCPFFYYSDYVIGETTCDGKKKMFEFLGKNKPVHVMQLPQETAKEASKAMWKSEILEFKDLIEKVCDTKITTERISQAIKLRNKERDVLKEFHELGKLKPAAISGTDMLKNLFAAMYAIDRSKFITSLENTTKDMKQKYNQGDRPVPEKAKRILLTGCPVGGSTEKVVKNIEEAGGVVVAFESCSGIKTFDKKVDETKEPIEALSEYYLGIGCSCMSPNNNRMDLISRLVDEYQVDGVVDMILLACHTYNVEAHEVKRFVTEEKNIPYINIETDYSQADVGQLQTRFAAFVEML